MTDGGDFDGDGDGYGGLNWYDADGGYYAAHPSVIANYAQSAPFEPGVCASSCDPEVLPDHVWMDPAPSTQDLFGAGPTAMTNRGLSAPRVEPVRRPRTSWWSGLLRLVAFWR